MGACSWGNLPKGESPVLTCRVMEMGGKQLWPEIGVIRLAQNYTVKHSFSEEPWDMEKLTWERKENKLARERSLSTAEGS